MFGKFFRRSTGYVDVQGDEVGLTKKNKWIIFLIIGAICFMAFGNLGGGDKDDKSKNKTNEKTEIVLSEYEKQTEERLGEIISKVKGAGNVQVMVTFETIYEKVLAKNVKQEQTSDIDGEKSSNSSGEENSILIYDSGTQETPFVVKERLPMPSGVLVVASGAGDEGVRLEIYEAVKALYGISGHRIKVVSAANKK